MNEEHDEKNPHRPEDNEQPPIKINLADSNKADQENFEAAVYQTRINVDVTTSDTGQELMDELNDKSTPNPDVIFMEQHMELDNGDDVLEEIKNDNELKDIPTVIYTEGDNPKDVADAYHAGADMYIQKPLFFRNLVQMLRRIFMVSWQELFFRTRTKKAVVTELKMNEVLQANIPTHEPVQVENHKRP